MASQQQPTTNKHATTALFAGGFSRFDFRFMTQKA